MAGGNKKKFNKPKSRYRNPSGGSLFIKGGILDDWAEADSPSSRGRKSSGGKGNGSGNRSGSGKGKGKVGSNAKSESARKLKGSEIGFVYPSTDGQKSTLADDAEGENALGNSQPMILLKSGETSIVAYVDEGPYKSAQTAQTVEYTCEYDTSFVLGDSSHRGLGFSDEVGNVLDGSSHRGLGFNDEAGNILDDGIHRGLGFNDEAGQLEKAVGSSSLKEDKGAFSFEQSCSDKDIDADVGSETGISESDDEFMDETSSVEEKNPGFLTIGGMRIYTQDISDEDDDEESVDEELSGSSESEDSTGSSESDDSSYSGSDIDEEVAADYFEGIGGSGKIVNVDQLIGQMSDASDDDIMERTSTRTLEEKLGGIALQDASREYGSKKSTPSRKYNVEDDLMLVKDPRILSGRKMYAASYLKSSSYEAKKSNRSRRFPGEKKKKRKETVAVKRRERMILRGVDPQKINSKLEKIVLNGIDIFSFQPMHHRDCAQVRRLAAIYQLHSGCQNSGGKKRFVTVTRTQHTSMPSPSDRARLEKLVGAKDAGADFTVNDASLRGKTTYKKVLRDGISTLPKKSTKSRHDTNKKKKPDKASSYAAQPISFVSCGTMDSAIEVKNNESPDTSDSSHGKGASSSVEFGSFELHTTGFGSKMMAKMGFAGGGLGKDGQGISKPVEVSQRPKSLGLGAEIPEPSSNSAKKEHHRARSDKLPTRRKSFRLGADIPETSSNSAKKECHRARGEKLSTRHKANKKEPLSFGAFEQHTKGFGSKMMAKMGFMEGMGLGRDSQGIINPLEASRRPKGQGLGSRS